jgi:hypothetical protein
LEVVTANTGIPEYLEAKEVASRSFGTKTHVRKPDEPEDRKGKGLQLKIASSVYLASNTSLIGNNVSLGLAEKCADVADVRKKEFGLATLLTKCWVR